MFLNSTLMCPKRSRVACVLVHIGYSLEEGRYLQLIAQALILQVSTFFLKLCYKKLVHYVRL